MDDKPQSLFDTLNRKTAFHNSPDEIVSDAQLGIRKRSKTRMVFGVAILFLGLGAGVVSITAKQTPDIPDSIKSLQSGNQHSTGKTSKPLIADMVSANASVPKSPTLQPVNVVQEPVNQTPQSIPSASLPAQPQPQPVVDTTSKTIQPAQATAQAHIADPNPRIDPGKPKVVQVLNKRRKIKAVDEPTTNINSHPSAQEESITTEEILIIR